MTPLLFRRYLHILNTSRYCEREERILPWTARETLLRMNSARLHSRASILRDYLPLVSPLPHPPSCPNKTVDLFEGKDIGLVVRCVFSLGSAVQLTCPQYTGPSLGAKLHQVKTKDYSRCRRVAKACPQTSTCFAAKARAIWPRNIRRADRAREREREKLS